MNTHFCFYFTSLWPSKCLEMTFVTNWLKWTGWSWVLFQGIRINGAKRQHVPNKKVNTNPLKESVWISFLVSSEYLIWHQSSLWIHDEHDPRCDSWTTCCYGEQVDVEKCLPAVTHWIWRHLWGSPQPVTDPRISSWSPPWVRTGSSALAWRADFCAPSQQNTRRKNDSTSLIMQGSAEN